jgi:anti-anti-sigma regulatory factor
MDSGDEYIVSGTVTRNCFVANIQGELTRGQMDRLYDRIVLIAVKRELQGVILDLSGLAVLDSITFSILRKISAALGLMGLKTAWMGLNPAMASSLVDFDADVNGLCICRNIEHGLGLIESAD